MFSNNRYRKNVYMKTIACIMTVLLLFNSIPQTVQAAMTVTKDNTHESNQEILNTLQNAFGDDTTAEAVLQEMDRLGLLNGDGELVTSSINVDGNQMTLDEIRDLIHSEDVDLSKTITIDGTSITLNNLKTMIEIEDEIQRLKDTYFSDDITLNEAQQMALDSLRNQIETQGIMMLRENTNDIEFPSGIDHRIYAEVDTQEAVYENVYGEKSVTVSLKDSNGNTLSQAPDYDISISYRFLDGSAKNRLNYNGTDGILTFEANGPAIKEIPFSILNDEVSHFEGKRMFLFQYYNPQNVLLQDHKRTAEKKIFVHSDFTWPEINRVVRLEKECIKERIMSYGIDKYYTTPAQYHVSDDVLTLMEADYYDTLLFHCNDSRDFDMFSSKIFLVFGNDNGKLLFDPSNQSEPFKYRLIYNSTLHGAWYAIFDFDSNWASYMKNAFSDEDPPHGGLIYQAFSFRDADNYVDIEFEIEFENRKAPVVKEVTIPNNVKFEYGQSIPITVEFSEPIDFTWNPIMDINGRTLIGPVEEGFTGSGNRVTFLYKVDKKLADTFLNITNIKGWTDLSHYFGDRPCDGPRFNDVIENLCKIYSFTNTDVDINTDENGLLSGTVSIEISDNEDLTLWLINEAGLYYDETVDKYKVPSIYASIDGGETKIDLYVDDGDNPTKLVGNFTPEINTTQQDITRAVEFYLDPEMDSVSNHELMVGKYAAYTVPASVFLEENDFNITDNFPGDHEIFAQDNLNLRLDYTVTKQDATWKGPDDFVWSSSDDTIAAIDSDGNIYPTGTPGTVTFTLTAKNGDVEGKAVSVTSEPLTIKTGLTPFLNIPDNGNVISIQNGESGEVRWISNLIAKNGENSETTEFIIKMYETDYSDGTLQKGELIYDQTVVGSNENPVASHVIPKQYLTDISVIGKYSYIVEVSSQNPFEPENMLIDTAYVDISSKPAFVKLEKLNSYFMTDRTESLPITWNLENYDIVNDAEFEFSITDNADNTLIYNDTATENTGGSYTFNIPKVQEGFKDIYTVEVKAKNDIDSTWSYDSFVLYVYDSESLKIWIDQAPNTSYTMSNIDRISSMTSEEILALNRNIALKNVLSINYGDYGWGQIRDQIKWDSSDSDVASINYRYASFYENIENLNYTSYRPASELILSGLKDGTTQVTAAHAGSGMESTVDVNVETLKDRLYLFQIYPRAKTTLTFINGRGKECSVDTNDKGELALYEESGIKSEIYMNSTFDDKEYMGTLYDNLVSSEKDSTKLKLYPVNNFSLKEVATADLYFKRSDGTPFTGDVILRGGVYKNGEYCSEARLNQKSGKQDQTITIGQSGKFTVNMDSSQFWVDENDEVLNCKDKLKFIFEVRFPGDDYYPQLLSVDGKMDNQDRKNVRVRPVPAGEKYKPFITIQDIDYGFESGRTIEVLNYNGKIGPGHTSDNINLNTTVLWWGEDITSGQDKHKLTFKDQFGIIPRGQSNETLIYPFSTIKGTHNTFVLNRNTMNGWLKPKYSRGMSLEMTDSKGNPYMEKTMPFRIINMLDAEEVVESDSLFFFLETMSSSCSADASALNLDDAVIGEGLNYLSQQGIGNTKDKQLFSMVVSPTVDPTVFTAFIQVNAGNMEDDNVTGIYSDNNLDSDLDAIPSMNDISAMQKGEYRENLKKTREKNPANGLSEANRNFSYTLGGYMEAEIIYNYDKEKWEILILNGGFHAGGGVNYDWNYNTFVGPVPVTAQFAEGASLELDFKGSAQRGEEIRVRYDKDAVNNFLTTLRIYAYIKAFAGMGFDYSVAAIKIGLFGQISIDAQFAFLNQPHISKTAAQGHKLMADGKVGIEFIAKCLFISYEKILASKNYNIVNLPYGYWNEIQDRWKQVQEGSSGNPGILSAASLRMQDGSVMYPVSSSMKMEDRDYLKEFERNWVSSGGFGILSLDPENGVKDLETNSYPYSNPVLTDDGQIMLYVSDADSTDVEDTEICWTKMTAGSYPNGNSIEVNSDSHGDSQLKLSGDANFASAVWVKQSEGIKKEAGDAVTYTDVALMSNSTEIMAAIYDGTNWTTTQLTNNTTPDMAPVVATNGDKVFVAWRSVYAADASKPLDFSGSDIILYRIYDEGTWTEPKILYNGTSGAVKGIEAAMLSDGTSAVTYTIETEVSESTVGVNSGLETVYAIVDNDGNTTKNVRLTNDTYIDENPQITTVQFDDLKERFVLGWYSVHDADGIKTNDIRLCSFDNTGALYGDFIESISSVNDNAQVNISSNFRFLNNADSIYDLSILWTEKQNTGISDEGKIQADKDLLKAVKFMNDEGRIYITSALDIAEMNDFTLINHFSAYNAGNDTIKAVILGTDYGNGYEEITIKVEENGEIVDQTISMPIAQSGLYTATGTYENEIEIISAAFDYDSVIRGMRIPVQFTIFNAGVKPVNSISIQLGGETTVFNQNLFILPNESITLTVYYDIPTDKVINPEYTVTASFQNEPEKMLAENDVKTDTLYMDIPDVGISNLESISQESGERVMQATLYNNSDIDLTGTDRIVKIGFYADEECSVLVNEVAGQGEGEPYTVDPANFSLIDAGAYTKQFTFDIASYVGEGNEIPEGGIRLYAKAWIEEPIQNSDETDTIIEYYQNNNFESILFESLLTIYDSPVTISNEQVNENSITRALVNVKNNSLVDTSTGNLIVSLLDNNGNIIETQQSYNTQENNNGLLSLNGEESTEKGFTFNTMGESLTVSYSNLVLDEDNNATLSSLSMAGIPLDFEKDKTEYTVQMQDLKDTFVSSALEDPNASVTINDYAAEFGNQKIHLAYGKNIIKIIVTAADGNTTKTYTVNINNINTNDRDKDGHKTSIRSNIFKPSVIASKGVANLKINNSDIDKLIDKAADSEDNEIIIAPNITGNANRMVMEFPGAGLSDIASNDNISMRLENPIMNLRLNNEVLKNIANVNGKNITIVTENKEGKMRLSIKVDDKIIDHIDGGITGIVRTPNTNSGTVAQLINEDGIGTIIKYSYARNDEMIIPLNGSSTIEIVDNAVNFTDIQNHSMKNSVDFISARNLFMGTSENTFSPDISMTRGMVVTVLGRLNNISSNNTKDSRFYDVPKDRYCAPYVNWAEQNNIINGVSDNAFAPEEPITREQLAVIISNYIKFTKLKMTEVTNDLTPFADQKSISSYAREGIKTIQRAGIIFGKDNNYFDPQGKATRVQVAAILERLIRNIIR